MSWSLYSLLAVLCAAMLYQAWAEPCPNDCSGNGRCHSPGRVCICFDGYAGADCSLHMCPFGLAWSDLATGTDVAHQSAECSNMGTCDRTTGDCTCREGFEGKACERKSCNTFCGNVGKCQSMYYYAQTKDPGEGTVYTYENIWDAHKMYGCNCDEDYDGYDCALRRCPVGDDPMTGNGADTTENPVQYNEQQQITCKAGAGTFTLTFRGKTTVEIDYNADVTALTTALEDLPTLGTGHVTVLMSGSQACTESGSTSTSFTVEFLQEFGSLPLLVTDSSKLSMLNAVSGNVVLTAAKQIDGTKESRDCSGRGICDTTTGYCTCNTNYATSNGYAASGTRGDCGYATATIAVCPGAISCSGHGECAESPTYKCSCSDGWTGSDCSQRTCPTDVSWFTKPSADDEAHISEDVECSDMGACDRDSGVCTCDTGFTGAACQTLTCPGEADLCNGHGECLDMTTLATLATVNGELAGYTYGATPNDPDTWDGLKVFGCFCDDEYTGYDCSLRTCPYGDDPLTTQQLDERQIISCTDTDSSGTISFTFREETTTTTILPTATTTEVKALIETLSTTGTVYVDVVTDGNSDSLCTASGNQFSVTFSTEHGDLPLLKATVQNVDSLVITEEQAGTKEMIECSGRGICNTATGDCECFSGFGSSDGAGAEGSKGDCGYTEPIVALEQ